MRRRLREEIDYQVQNGVDGVCVFGSTGGNGSFTDEEMKETTAWRSSMPQVASRSSPEPARGRRRHAFHCRIMRRMRVAMA